jgi:hypothetical protein
MSYRDNPIKINKELSKPMDLMNVGFVGNIAVAPIPDPATVSSNNATNIYTNGGKTYYKYNGGGQITFNQSGNGLVKLMLIGGGGAGAGRYYGGGAGAGGMYYDDVIVTAQQYNITIGGSNTNSTALGKTALRGGTGNNNSNNSGVSGGCGGGAGYGQGDKSSDHPIEQQSTSASGGIGFNGGNDTVLISPAFYPHGGGGGGLGAKGVDGTSGIVGNGGIGRSNSQLDNILTITSSGTGGYIGGGGGATANHWNSGTGGQGGSGGGGSSADWNGGGSLDANAPAQSGVANTGSGGGSAGRNTGAGGGGSGICIIIVG